MSDALVGHTGFVGGNLAAQHRFDAVFHSNTIDGIRGRRFRRLVVSAMPAEMWVANRDPVADRATLERLWTNLAQCHADECVVISTVAVYPTPIGVDEATFISTNFTTPYGEHRWELERRVRWHFPRSLAVRLPALYGPGLKKNAVYDLLHNNRVEHLHPAATYQYYPLGRLGRDIETALAAGLRRVNLATEPVGLSEVARAVFGRELKASPATRPACFDVRTAHAALFGGRGNYLESRDEVLAGLSRFVAAERAASPSRLAA